MEIYFCRHAYSAQSKVRAMSIEEAADKYRMQLNAYNKREGKPEYTYFIFVTRKDRDGKFLPEAYR